VKNNLRTISDNKSAFLLTKSISIKNSLSSKQSKVLENRKVGGILTLATQLHPEGEISEIVVCFEEKDIRSLQEHVSFYDEFF
jgi:hypothetical protein